MPAAGQRAGGAAADLPTRRVRRARGGGRPGACCRLPLASTACRLPAAARCRAWRLQSSTSLAPVSTHHLAHLSARRWVEQDPLAIWRSVQDAAAQCMEAALEQHGALTVVAVGITNQREPAEAPAASIVACARSAGRHLHAPARWPRLTPPATLRPQARRRWSGTARRGSRCTTPLCGWTTAPRGFATSCSSGWARKTTFGQVRGGTLLVHKGVASGHADASPLYSSAHRLGWPARLPCPPPVLAVTGLPISTYFSAYKLKWLMDHVPAVAAAAAAGRAAFGTVDSWLIYNMTGQWWWWWWAGWRADVGGQEMGAAAGGPSGGGAS